jgi:hypothetical protein
MVTTTVSQLTRVVKSHDDDAGKRLGHTCLVSTLLERLELVLKIRGIDQRELARRAELGNEKNVGVLFHRLRKDPARQIQHDTLVKIAKGARVSVNWLATGEGSPDETEPSEDPRPIYRNVSGWPEVESALKARGYDPAAIEVFGDGRALVPLQSITLEMALTAMPLAIASLNEEQRAKAIEAGERKFKAAETKAARNIGKGKSK